MNTSVDSQSSPAVPTPAKPPRNPVERIAVWGGIGLLLVVVAFEFRAQRGYAQTLEALNASTTDEEHETTFVQARQLLAFAPAVSAPVSSGMSDEYTCSWYSLFKPGQYEIKLVTSRDKEPILLAFTTSNAPPEPEPKVTPYTGGGAAPASPSGMGGMGMGGGPGGAGRPRRPGGAGASAPAGEAPASTAEVPPASSGDAAKSPPATGTP